MKLKDVNCQGFFNLTGLDTNGRQLLSSDLNNGF